LILRAVTTKYTKKKIKAHSAKLNKILIPSSAQLGPPSRVLLIAVIIPSYSTLV
jgi:uncharacterized membrane protein (DUF106 family)